MCGKAKSKKNPFESFRLKLEEFLKRSSLPFFVDKCKLVEESQLFFEEKVEKTN